MRVSIEQVKQAMKDNPDLPESFVIELLDAQDKLEDAEDAITVYRRRNSKTVPVDLGDLGK